MKWWDTRWWDEVGNCTECGCEEVKVKMVDEATYACEDCLHIDFFYCDKCGEFWRCDAVEEIETYDGRTLCEYCVEED